MSQKALCRQQHNVDAPLGWLRPPVELDLKGVAVFVLGNSSFSESRSWIAAGGQQGREMGGIVVLAEDEAALEAQCVPRSQGPMMPRRIRWSAPRTEAGAARVTARPAARVAAGI
jgi:hypothetical protein